MEMNVDFIFGDEGELFFEQRNGRLKKIAYGNFILKRRVKLIEADGSLLEERIEIIVFQSGGETGRFTKTCESIHAYLSSTAFKNDLICNGLIFAPQISRPERYIEAYALAMLRDLPSRDCYVLKQGFSEVAGNQYFVFGDSVFSEVSNSEILVEPKKALDLKKYKSNGFFLPDKNFLDTVFLFLEIDKRICPLILLYSCFSVLQDFFLCAGVSSRFVLALEGETGLLKSSAARIVTDIYEKKSFLTFGSSLRAIQHDLHKMAVAPVLIDDVNKSNYRETTNRRGIALSEIVQGYSERAIVSKMQGNKEINYKIESGLIVTVEEMPSNPSTINRCVIVPVSAKIDKDKLKHVQDRVRNGNPFVQFYCSLAKYVLSNFRELRPSLKLNYEQIRSKGEELFACDSDEVAGFERIVSSYALLISTLAVFRNYLLDSGVDSNVISEIEGKLEEAAKDACFETMKRVMKKNTKHEIIDAIYDLHEQTWLPQNRIGCDIKEYLQKINMIGFEEDEVLFIRGEVLKKELEENRNSSVYGRRLSLKEISDELRRFSLLKVDAAGKCSHHVSGGFTKKRFYVIYMRELERIEGEFFQRKFGKYIDDMIVQVWRDD